MRKTNDTVRIKQIMKQNIRHTFSSEVLLRKQRKASENWSPQGPLLKSAIQGHSRAFWAISSTFWKNSIKFQFFNDSFIQFNQLAKVEFDVKMKTNKRVNYPNWPWLCRALSNRSLRLWIFQKGPQLYQILVILVILRDLDQIRLIS